jgi:V/A-type H+/Na+-transporting ATPase subunit I
MAIAKIKKVEIIGLQQDKEQLLNLLQRMGVMEIVPAAQVSVVVSPIHGKESDIADIEQAILFLSGFRKSRKMLGGMVVIKPLVYQAQAEKIIRSFDYRKATQELAQLEGALGDLEQKRNLLLQEARHLQPWQSLQVPLDAVHATQQCDVVLGVFGRRDYAKFTEESVRLQINVFSELVHQDTGRAYLALLYERKEVIRLEALLKECQWNQITLNRHPATVTQRLSQIDREIRSLDHKTEQIRAQVVALADEQLNLMVVYDYLDNARKRRVADKDLARQRFTFSLAGWVREKDALSLRQALAAQCPVAAIFISEPEGDSIPVVLENPALIQPFEFITKIYGMPKYGELDPTPFLAPFFFVYFGFCVSDAGYGLLITLACWWALKKFHMGPQGKRFFKLFMFCGVSTVVAGALTGSWFGNLFDIACQYSRVFLPLKKFKDSLIILDPFQEPTKLLVIALSMGICQIWFGNIVAIIGNIKNRRYWDIVFDQVSMLVLLFGLTGLGLGFLGALPQGNTVICKYAALAGAIALVFTQGRSEKGIGAKLFFGVYNLYNALSGYLSDVLSYSRLWALGLVTGVMANTINLISVQFSQIFSSLIPFTGAFACIKLLLAAVILTVVLVVGHLVSFLMNLLGAFVHPVRLQFVEFFSKFFKSGGAAFKPFKQESKYVTIS